MRAILYCLPALLVACSNKVTEPEPDTGLPDVGVDSARDTFVPDSGSTDSADAEASEPLDGGPTEFYKGEWWNGTSDPLTPNCPAISKNPTLAAPPLEWESCGTGCQKLVTSWTEAKGQWQFTLDFNNPSISWAGNTPYLMYAKGHIVKGDSIIDGLLNVLAEMPSAKARLVTRTLATLPSCFTYPKAGAAGIGFFTVSVEERLYYGLSTDGTSVRYRECGPSCAFGNRRDFHVLADAILIERSEPVGFARLDAKTFVNTKLNQPLQYGAQDLEGKGVYGIDVANTSGRQAVGYQGSDGSGGPVAFALGKANVSGVMVDHTSPALVWAETDGAKVAIYSSPLATKAEDIKRRLVTRYEEAPEMRGASTLGFANKGMLLVTVKSTEMRLIRLSDGKAWSIPAPKGATWQRPTWVDENEVWVTIDDLGVKASTGAIRLSRATLGEPTIPAGI